MKTELGIYKKEVKSLKKNEKVYDFISFDCKTSIENLNTTKIWVSLQDLVDTWDYLPDVWKKMIQIHRRLNADGPIGAVRGDVLYKLSPGIYSRAMASRAILAAAVRLGHIPQPPPHKGFFSAGGTSEIWVISDLYHKRYLKEDEIGPRIVGPVEAPTRNY